MVACGPKPEPEEKVEPSKISMDEAFQEFFMEKGESNQLTVTVAPKNINVDYTIAWESEDEDIVSVDENGMVTAVAKGSTTVKASIPEYPDVKPAKAEITVLDEIAVGDFLYADGSWGKSTLDKDIIAVVYWKGNPTLFDPILEADYANCTHGLAMSLKQAKHTVWQKDADKRMQGGDGADLKTYEGAAAWGEGALCRGENSMAEWGAKVSSYGDLIRPYYENADLRINSSFCGVGGYTYTYIFEEFMNSDPEASKYPIEIYTNTMDLVKGIETPATTSKWYVPSAFEAALMVNDAITKPTDFNKSDEVVANNTNTLTMMNTILGKVSGADLLPTTGYLATATDIYADFSSANFYGLNCAQAFMFAALNDPSKSSSETDEEFAARKQAVIDNVWVPWLTANEFSAEDIAKYKDLSEHDRLELFAQHYGVDTSINPRPEIATWDVVQELQVQAGFGLLLGLLAANVYECVNLTNGKSGYVNLTETGQKYQDKGNDVLRAVVAF